MVLTKNYTQTAEQLSLLFDAFVHTCSLHSTIQWIPHYLI
jgi:hypothetical protein